LQKRMIHGVMVTMVFCLSLFGLSVRRVNGSGLIGDVNGDGKVNIKDEYMAGLAFGSRIGDSRYNPRADLNGDGGIDNLDLYLITTHFGESAIETVTVAVCVCPKTLNLRSCGRWISVHIKLPVGYCASDIDVSTLMLNGTVPADSRLTIIGGNDSGRDLLVKFNRAKVIQCILNSTKITEKPTTVTLTITGKLKNGTLLQGSDNIKVMRCPSGEK